MKFRYLALFTASIALFPAAHTEAGSRYDTPPAAQLSQDLASPWLLQLKQKPVGRTTRSGRTRSVAHQPVNQKRFKPQYGTRPIRRSETAAPSTGGTGIFQNFSNPFAAPQPVSRQSAPKRSYRQQHQVVRPIAPKTQAFGYASQPKPKPRPARPQIDPKYFPQNVNYSSNHAPGTIIVDADSRFLYLVTSSTEARRYGVGVGKEGFEWSGSNKISGKKEWPSWRPPAEMIAREREKGRELPEFMEGGPKNPLGARALYIGDTLYRIHGTNQPWTIGQAVSSGCIRMRNEDVIDLYERVNVGAKVIVSQSASG